MKMLSSEFGGGRYLPYRQQFAIACSEKKIFSFIDCSTILTIISCRHIYFNCTIWIMKFNRSNFFKSTIATLFTTSSYFNANALVTKNNNSMMKYKRLGNTDIYPSQIVMGTAQWKDETFLEPFHLSFESLQKGLSDHKGTSAQLWHLIQNCHRPENSQEN